MPRGKHYATNTFVKAIKKKPLNNRKIHNSSKNLLSKHIKVTKKYNIVTSINNIIKKPANIYKL